MPDEFDEQFERRSLADLRAALVARGLCESPAAAAERSRPLLVAELAADERRQLRSRSSWTRTAPEAMYRSLLEAAVYPHVAELVTLERLTASLPTIRAVVLSFPGARDQLYVEVLGRSKVYDDIEVVEGSIQVHHDAANTVRALRFEGLTLHFTIDRWLEEGEEGQPRSVALAGYDVFAHDFIEAV